MTKTKKMIAGTGDSTEVRVYPSRGPTYIQLPVTTCPPKLTLNIALETHSSSLPAP